MRAMSALARSSAVVLLGAVASGCALPVQSEMDQMSGVARYATSYDHVVDARANLLERTLADCPEKTVKAETACVRQGVDASSLSVPALMALVPQCRAGQVCHYDHTTRDRLGFVQANATDYVKRWRVDLDVRHPAATAAQVPITVIDRDDFDGTAAPATPG